MLLVKQGKTTEVTDVETIFQEMREKEMEM